MEFIEKKDHFFTKKKIIVFSLLTTFIVVFIALISAFVLNINFRQIGQIFTASFMGNNSFFLWFFLLLLFPIYFVFWRIYLYWSKLKKDNIKVKWYEWILFGLVSAFLNAITPFSIGNEPYTIFWLKSKGVSVKRATVITASNGVLAPFIQILITWPSFFIITASYATNSGDANFITAYWFGFIGLMADLIVFTLYWTLAYSRRIHLRINRIWHWLRRKVKLSYKTKAEITEEYYVNASFKKEFLNELKDYKNTAIIVVGTIIWNFLFYFSVIFALEMLGANLAIDYFSIFNFTNVAITANNFIPIPNGEGTLQLVLFAFIRSEGIQNSALSDGELNVLLNSGIFIWRVFTSYVLSFLGLIAFLISAFLFYKESKQQRRQKSLEEIKHEKENL